MLERTARLPAALDAYQAALEHDRDSPQLFTRLGATYVKLGEPARALQMFERALTLDPQHADALRWLALLYTSQGKLHDAITAYEQLLDVESDDLFIMSRLADLYVLQGDLAKAITLYRRLIAEQGASSQLHFNLGVLSGRLGHTDEAIEELSRAVELAPESLEARVALGLTYELQGRFDQAAAHYEEALLLDPLNPRLYHHAARAYIAGNDLMKAAMQYQTILDLVPNDFEAIMGLVRVWILQRQFDRALGLLAEKLKTLGHPPELYVALGILYRQMEEHEEAMRAFERALALRTDYTQAHFYLAAEFDQLGRKELARARLRRTLELDPHHADAMNYLGYLDAEAGVNLEGAKVLIERALLLDPTNGAYVDSLGWVYFQMGRLEQAIATLERAAELLGSDPIAFDHLGDAYFKQGAYEAARRNWQRALELDPEQPEIQQKLDRLVPDAVTVSEPSAVGSP